MMMVILTSIYIIYDWLRNYLGRVLAVLPQLDKDFCEQHFCFYE